MFISETRTELQNSGRNLQENFGSTPTVVLQCSFAFLRNPVQQPGKRGLPNPDQDQIRPMEMWVQMQLPYLKILWIKLQLLVQIFILYTVFQQKSCSQSDLQG